MPEHAGTAKMSQLHNTTALPASGSAGTGKPGSDFTPSQLVPNALLRTKDVCAVAGMSRPTLYEAMAAGLWPRPIKLGAKSSAWKASEVNAMLAARVRGASDDEIRQLVIDLTAARFECV